MPFLVSFLVVPWEVMATNITSLRANWGESWNNTSNISSADVTEAITLTVILVLSLMGNSLVCYYGITSTRILAMNQLIVNLAFAEILLVVLVLPIRIQRQLKDNFKSINPDLCRLLQYFQTVALGVINITMAMIALDRYFSTFRHGSKITLRKAKYMVLVSWCLPLLTTSPIFFDLSGRSAKPRQLLLRCNQFEGTSMSKFEQAYSLFQIITVCILPMFLLYAIYFVMILRILRIDASHKNLKLSQAPGTRKSPCGTFREELPVAKRRALVMNFIVSSLFLVCWTPTVTLYMIQVIIGHGDNSLYDLLSYIALANLSFNPLIYCFFDSVFRNQVFCCLRHKWGLGRARNNSSISESLTADKLTELHVSKIDLATASSACTDQEPLLTRSAVQPIARPSFLSRDKLARLVCNTRRYRSLGLSRSSEI